MKRPNRHPEEVALRYDYALAHESMTMVRVPKKQWASDYELCLFERLCILAVLVGPAIAVWWVLG